MDPKQFVIQDRYRPRVWWHWMNGNLSEQGLIEDLDWFSRIGVGGVQIFEGGLGARQFVTPLVAYRSDEWKKLFLLALREAKSRGLETTVTTSAGWSLLGGPWVSAKDAMKKIVWSETVIEPGSEINQLAPLPSSAGSFQDSIPLDGQPITQFSKDYVWLAVEERKEFSALVPESVHLSKPFEGDLASLSDGRFSSWISTEKSLTDEDSLTCKYTFGQPVTVSAVTVGMPGPTGFGAPALPALVLEGSNDGTNFEWISDFPMRQTLGQVGEIQVRSISFQPVTYRHYRLTLVSQPLSSAVPRMEIGVRPLPFVPKLADRFLISEFSLFESGRVHGFEYKAGYAIYADYSKLNQQTGAATSIAKDEIVDLTSLISQDGKLSWPTNDKRWRIFRIGASLTGSKNGPAPEGASGLEVDKLSKKRVLNYLSEYFTLIFETIDKSGSDRGILDAILTDSIESRAQNFTEELGLEFEKRRGYNLNPWLLSACGWLVESIESTDKFLFDFRKTISELGTEATYGGVSEFAKKNGFRYYSEALESHRPQLGNDLDMRSHADIPMGAMWTWFEDELPNPTYIADLKGASSVSHVYGKEQTGCESFSTFGKPFSLSPKSLKKVADLELSLGVTLFNIHSSPHQPKDIPGPGMTLAPTLGQVFSRNETWAEFAKSWLEYLGRCSTILNQGKPTAEILYLIDEDSSVTGKWGDSSFDVPSGFDFDLISPLGLEKLRIIDGRIHSEQGNYALLYVACAEGGVSTSVLRKLKGFAEKGATIFLKETFSSPSLEDDEISNAKELEQLCLKPSVYVTDTISSAITQAVSVGLLQPDWEFRVNGLLVDSGFRPSSALRCIHRHSESFDVYFLANATNERLEIGAKLSAKRKNTTFVDAVSPDLTWSLPRDENGQFSLDLGPFQTCFLFLSDEDPEGALTKSNEPVVATELTSWKAKVGSYICETGSTFDWTRTGLPEEVGHFSGTAEFSAAIDIFPETNMTYLLEFQELGELARVRVNDLDAGIAWQLNHLIDITGLLRSGNNLITLNIVNNWRNRLIGDEGNKKRDVESSETWIGYPIFEPDAPLQPSGILKPIRLLGFSNKERN